MKERNGSDSGAWGRVQGLNKCSELGSVYIYILFFLMFTVIIYLIDIIEY